MRKVTILPAIAALAFAACGRTVLAQQSHAPDTDVVRVDGPWFPAGNDGKGFSYEINIETVSGDPKQRRAWVRYTDVTKKDLTDQFVDLQVFDCVYDNSVTISSKRYKNGKYVGSGKTVPEFMVEELMEPVTPGTTLAHVQKLICTFPAEAVKPQQY